MHGCHPYFFDNQAPSGVRFGLLYVNLVQLEMSHLNVVAQGASFFHAFCLRLARLAKCGSCNYSLLLLSVSQALLVD